MKSARLGVILSMFAVFGSGLVVGAFSYHSYTAKTVFATAQPQPKRNPDEWRRKYVQELQSRLNLDEKQVGGLNAILDETRTRFRGMKERHRQEIDQVKVEQSDKVRAMLTPAQKPEYERFREERDRRMREEAAREQAAKQAAKAGN